MTAEPCDVLVIGAGVAGCCAAIAAGRAGRRTMLVEQETYFGGIGYAGMFPSICGLYGTGETMPQETLNSGFVREIAARIRSTEAGREVKRIGKVFVLPYDRQELDAILRGLAQQAGVLVLQGHRAIGLTKEGDTVAVAEVRSAAAVSAISPRVVIDCTGSGEAAALAGAEFDLSTNDERQLAGLTVRLTGIEDPDSALAITVPFVLSRAVRDKRLPELARFTMFHAGRTSGEGYLKLSIDPADRPDRDADAREFARQVHEHLAQELPAFRGSSITDLSPHVLQREERRIRCEYTLTADDVLGARKFPDGVAKNAWPIELWDRTKGTQYSFLPQGDHYEIPFRCLKVKGVRNLLVAGRCISTTREALGSTRVMGCCMALGEQAGLAAAEFCGKGTFPLLREE